MDYTLECLIEEFKRHAAEYERFTGEWNESNPTTLRDPQAFILPRALQTLAFEIKQLKDKYEANQPQIPTDVSGKESENPQVPL